MRGGKSEEKRKSITSFSFHSEQVKAAIPILSEYLYKLEGNLTMRVFCTLSAEALCCYSLNPFEESAPHLVTPLQEIGISNINIQKLLTRGARAVSLEDCSSTSRHTKSMDLVFPSAQSMENWLGCLKVLSKSTGAGRLDQRTSSPARPSGPPAARISNAPPDAVDEAAFEVEVLPAAYRALSPPSHRPHDNSSEIRPSMLTLDRALSAHSSSMPAHSIPSKLTRRMEQKREAEVKRQRRLRFDQLDEVHRSRNRTHRSPSPTKTQRGDSCGSEGANVGWVSNMWGNSPHSSRKFTPEKQRPHGKDDGNDRVERRRDGHTANSRDRHVRKSSLGRGGKRGEAWAAEESSGRQGDADQPAWNALHHVHKARPRARQLEHAERIRSPVQIKSPTHTDSWRGRVGHLPDTRRQDRSRRRSPSTHVERSHTSQNPPRSSGRHRSSNISRHDVPTTDDCGDSRREGEGSRRGGRAAGRQHGGSGGSGGNGQYTGPNRSGDRQRKGLGGRESWGGRRSSGGHHTNGNYDDEDDDDDEHPRHPRGFSEGDQSSAQRRFRTDSADSDSSSSDDDIDSTVDYTSPSSIVLSTRRSRDTGNQSGSDQYDTPEARDSSGGSDSGEDGRGIATGDSEAEDLDAEVGSFQSASLTETILWDRQERDNGHRAAGTRKGAQENRDEEVGGDSEEEDSGGGIPGYLRLTQSCRRSMQGNGDGRSERDATVGREAHFRSPSPRSRSQGVFGRVTPRGGSKSGTPTGRNLQQLRGKSARRTPDSEPVRSRRPPVRSAGREPVRSRSASKAQGNRSGEVKRPDTSAANSSGKSVPPEDVRRRTGSAMKRRAIAVAGSAEANKAQLCGSGSGGTANRQLGGFFELYSGRIKSPVSVLRSGWSNLPSSVFDAEATGSDHDDGNLLGAACRRHEDSGHPILSAQSQSVNHSSTHASAGVSGNGRTSSAGRSGFLRPGGESGDLLEGLPPSINSLLKDSRLHSMSHSGGGVNVAGGVSSGTGGSCGNGGGGRFKTPDELRLKRPTREVRQRDVLTDAAEWSRMLDWLSSINMGKYAAAFRAGGVTKLSVMELLRFPDLIQLHIDGSDIPHIMNSIREISRRTKSFTEEALSPGGASPLPSPVTACSPASAAIRQSRPLTLSQRAKQTEGSLVSRPFLLSFSADNSHRLAAPYKVLSVPILLKAFDGGNCSAFVSLWSLLRSALYSLAKSSPTDDADDGSEAGLRWKQRLDDLHSVEFYCRLYFAVWPITAKASAESATEAMREMRVYLENLQHHQRGSRSVDSKGQQKDSSVTSLINSRLFAAYAGIVMVPDPAENPAYAALFDPKWRLNLRLKLISFLEGLRDLPAEEVSQAMPQKNKSTPQSAGVAAPVFSASLTGRRNSAGISPHSRRPEGLPTTTGRSSSVSAVSHAEVSQWRQSDRSGDHFDDGAREGRVRMRRSGSGESGTGLEAETEMMKVLSTLEASEKLNKALRDDSLNSASIAADATRQYRASVPREHIPAGTGSSGTGGGLGGGHVPQSQLFARVQAERDAGRTHSGPAGTDPSAAAGKSSWTREGIAMADGSPGSMPSGGPLSIDRNMGADVECPPGVKSGRDDSKNDGNRDYEDDGDSLSSGEDDVCIPSAEELAHQDSEEEDPRSNAASATTGMDDKRSTEKKSSRRMSAMLGSGTMVMEIVSEEDETHRDDHWFGEEKTHMVTKTNAETPAAAAANPPSGESRRGTSLTLSQLRAASTQRDSAEPAATVAFVEPPGVSSATKGEAVSELVTISQTENTLSERDSCPPHAVDATCHFSAVGEPAVVEANARPKKSLRFHSDDAIDTVHFIDTTAPVKGDVGSSVARIEHGDESRVRDDLSHADDIWLVADQETAKTAKEEAAVPIEESSPVILSVTPPRRMSALLSEMTKQTSSSVSGSSVAINVGTEDVSVDAPMDAGSAAHVLSPPSSPLLSSLSGMSGDDTVVPPGPAAPVPFSPSENGDTEHKSRIGANTSSSLHQSSTLSLSPDHTGLDDEVVAPPISEPALSLWRCRDDSDSDDGESCEHAIVPAENASTSDQTEPAGNAYITYLRQNFKGLEDASSDADGCVDQQTSIQRSESATSGDYGDDDDNDFALQQELGMCTLKGQFMVLPEGQHDSPVISSGSGSAKVRRKSWDPPLMGEYSQMHSASDTPSPQAMSPISPDDCISGELASSPPSRSPCGSGDACASQSDDEDGTIPADVNGSDGILSSGGTLAGSLFRHLEGVSAGGMEPVALAATEAEEKQSAFKSARNSKISDLMAKFSHAPPEKTVAGDWDGWEQVGSRWLKKNPMSPEEIEVAASFYGSTRRHAKDGSRRQSDVSDAGQQAKSAEWSRAGETDTSLFQSVDARWSESKQQQDTDDIATVRQSTAYDVL